MNSRRTSTKAEIDTASVNMVMAVTNRKASPWGIIDEAAWIKTNGMVAICKAMSSWEQQVTKSSNKYM